ncbi:hypothetical protein O0544_14545 [Edwardsiella anguillarum]|nr:hypothetical protein [Edwardsiella anguillarum]
MALTLKLDNSGIGEAVINPVESIPRPPTRPTQRRWRRQSG